MNFPLTLVQRGDRTAFDDLNVCPEVWFDANSRKLQARAATVIIKPHHNLPPVRQNVTAPLGCNPEEGFEGRDVFLPNASILRFEQLRSFKINPPVFSVPSSIICFPFSA